MNSEQAQQIGHGNGFFAALDQSGGSTPKALREYGVADDQWSTEEQMFDLVHAMRVRVMASPAFTGDRILAAILFEQTMDREVVGQPTAGYLWEQRQVVPILKVDKGLADEVDQVQVMKDMPDLDALLDKAVRAGIFGTKMRSVIKGANEDGISSVVAQQLSYAVRILSYGLVPILEPEVDISAPDKAAAEAILKAQVLAGLDTLADDVQVMLKISIPSLDGFWADVAEHPRMMRVVALSGGYARDDACARLARNDDLIASFSRALLEGLTAEQSDDAFNATLAASVEQIYQASVTKA
ncbi:MAG: fructose bisphosphate aldolase [Nostocoides sp.]